MQRILLVDDHAMLRDAVSGALSRIGQRCQIYGLGTGNAALKWVEMNGLPDLVLLDIELPDGSGLEFLKTLRHCYPTLRIAMLSGTDDGATVQNAMAAGACGFVTKAVNAEALVAKVREIMGGMQSVTTAQSAWAPPASEPKSLEERYRLTKMQARVLERLLRGLRNREIADELQIAEGTVKTHTSAIFRAVGVDSRALLIAQLQQPTEK